MTVVRIQQKMALTLFRSPTGKYDQLKYPDGDSWPMLTPYTLDPQGRTGSKYQKHQKTKRPKDQKNLHNHMTSEARRYKYTFIYQDVDKPTRVAKGHYLLLSAFASFSSFSFFFASFMTASFFSQSSTIALFSPCIASMAAQLPASTLFLPSPCPRSLSSYP